MSSGSVPAVSASKARTGSSRPAKRPTPNSPTLTTEFTRFLVVADDQTAAVDAIGRYTDPEGEISIVSSCDVYEFRDDLVTQITSYTVELQPPA